MPSDWKPRPRQRDERELRRFRLLHVGELCEGCGLVPGIHVHHEIFRSRSGDDAFENLSWLCGRCHDARHGIHSIWA